MKVELLNDETSLIRINGSIELVNVNDIKYEIGILLEKGIVKLLLDFSKVEYVDSSGLGMLVSIKKKVNQKDGEIILFSLQKAVKRIVELTDLDKLFVIKENEKDAIEELGREKA